MILIQFWAAVDRSRIEFNDMTFLHQSLSHLLC